MSQRWCSDTCPQCHAPSVSAVVKEHGGIVSVWHLCRNSHAWRVEFVDARLVA